ncbi:MAG: hypothetical protein ABSD73_09910 [Candidatus Bathyarchaeia archaeon]
MTTSLVISLSLTGDWFSDVPGHMFPLDLIALTIVRIMETATTMKKSTKNIPNIGSGNIGNVTFTVY